MKRSLGKIFCSAIFLTFERHTASLMDTSVLVPILTHPSVQGKLCRGGILEGTMSSKSRLEPAWVGSGQLGKGIGIFYKHVHNTRCVTEK
jgi:hypothetical protein